MQKDPLLLAGTEIYRPLCVELRQFRLLTILPGQKSAKLCCLLRIASLDHDIIPAYRTISYVWGDSAHRSSILVNGTSLNVPYSATVALSRLRLPVDERVVWIDAVCINQTDLEERSAQVTIMGTIYANGRENLVFLGDDERLIAGGAVEVLKASAQRISVATKGLRQKDLERLRQGDVVPSWKDNTRILEGLDHDQYALLYSLPWFRRLWVLQEASLAIRSSCYWGSSEFMLSDVLLVAFVLIFAPANIAHMEEAAYAGTYAAARMHIRIRRVRFRWANQELSFCSFWDGLSTSRDFQATDARDHVFAPLQLYRAVSGYAQVPHSLSPNYRKSIGEVFQDAIRYVLVYEINKRDIVLRKVTHRSIEDLKTGFPSWVVRLDRPFSGSHDPMNLYNHRSGFRKDDGRFPELLLRHCAEEPGILELFVHKVDSISQMTRMSPIPLSEEDVADTQQLVMDFAALNNLGHEVKAGLLTAGKMGKFRSAKHRLEGYHHFLQHMKEHGRIPDPLSYMGRGSDVQSWSARLFWDTFSETALRRFFRTINGYLGWGPALMQASDLLVIAQGASVPYILRPVETGHLLIGSAWVHGLMNGEVFDLEGGWGWARIC